MRLICPKCNAQYDIASDAIPEGGRDVQCSSCSHTWFQTEETRPAASTVAPAAAAAASKVAAEVESAIKKRKPLDSSIADILRQEAARENAVFDDEAPATAPDIREPALTRPANPPAAQVNADETRRRVSMMAAELAETPASVAAAATGAVAMEANQRTVPSIDEINEQLRARVQEPDGIRLTEQEQEEIVQRRGFRRGFVTMLLLLAVAIAPYFFTEQIIAQFPQAAEPMQTYVETVDGLRLWLNDQFKAARTMIEGFTGGEATPASGAPAADPTVVEPTPASAPNTSLD
ncbi:zinc-ribbon domain-containing protein [Loktanella sp. S4079]|uniref:zinc-ribbon domain-containing protein n=1 Tax=Loktanella sp. S4079 TaxID=579483 RepID=UPI0006990246|nr:zinc-ribbon domain-containing protein [Loktanella sp. S4079]